MPVINIYNLNSLSNVVWELKVTTIRSRNAPTNHTMFQESVSLHVSTILMNSYVKYISHMIHSTVYNHTTKYKILPFISVSLGTGSIMIEMCLYFNK
jgi:hypothetical protein